jgi:hypothetical protein
VYSKVNSVPSETPSSSDQPAIHHRGVNRFGKKLYAIAAIIVIAVIAIALLIPQTAATIPLSVEYTVGEKMIYNTIEAVTFQADNTAIPAEQSVQVPNTTSINSTAIVNIVDFDGEYYTLNHTITGTLGQTPVSISFIEKVNKTGYTSYFLPGGTQQVMTSNMSNNPFVTALLAQPEVKVGDTWQIPMSSGNSNVSITGELTIKFGGIQDITVPAGTYRVFKIDVSSNNFTMNVKVPTHANNTIAPFTTNISISGQIYIEYGTCRQIQSNMQTISSTQAVGASATISTSTQTTLVQHIKPLENQPDANP